jgi:hypothetical protein
MLDKNHKRDALVHYNDSIMQLSSFKKFHANEHVIPFKAKAAVFEDYGNAVPGSFKTFL